MTNNYLLHTPVGHLDEFDLQALKNWKATLLRLPKILRSQSMIDEIGAKVSRLELHMKGRTNAG